MNPKTPQSRNGRMRRKSLPPNPVLYTFFTLALVALWEGVALLEVYPQTVFPPAHVVAQRLWILMVSGGLPIKVLYSVGTVFAGMGIALLGVLFAAALGRRFAAVDAFMVYMSAIAGPIPGVAILPLVVLWLGLSRAAMLFILVHAMIWPMWSTVNLGLQRLDVRYRRMLAAFRVPFHRQLIHVYGQGIVPDVLLALQIAWSRGWRALIATEMIFGIVGKHGGLGWLIYERRMYMDTAGMMAGLIAVAVCGIVFETVILKSKRLEAFFGYGDSTD